MKNKEKLSDYYWWKWQRMMWSIHKVIDKNDEEFRQLKWEIITHEK